MENAKKTLLRLQSGDPEVVRLWERLIEVTMEQVYQAARGLVLNLKLGNAASAAGHPRRKSC